MTDLRASLEGKRGMWAFCVFALGWDVVAAVATAVFALVLAPRLPPTVTISLPGRAAGATYEYAPGTLTIVLVASVIVVTVFALVLLALSFAGARLSTVWFGVILVVLNVLVTSVTSALVVSALLQLDRVQSIGVSGEYRGGLSLAVTGAGVLSLVLVLVSALFVVRRLTLGVWRAPGER